jgi:hypothetical protein
MTAIRRITGIASTRGIAGTLSFALLLGSAGCKNKESGPSSNLSKNDPLLAGPGRIPRQNIPLPDRGTAGGKRPEGPYVPGPGGSPAALAGLPLATEEEGLAIAPPGGVGLTPAGGSDRPVATAPAPATPLGSDTAFAELAKYGVKRGDYAVSREDNIVIVRVKVYPVADGPARSFTGQGQSETAAVKQVVDQLKSVK